MGPLVIESACFAYINISVTIYGEEELNLGVLGFAYYIIFISVNDKEVFDLRVLGRGRRRANSDFISFYIILLKKSKAKSLFYAIYLDLIYQIAILAILYDLRQLNLKISRAFRHLL